MNDCLWDLKDKSRDGFENDNILFGLKSDENLINDVGIIHLPIHIRVGGGHFCLFSVVVKETKVVISDSYYLEILDEHMEVSRMLISYLEEYKKKMCGLETAWNWSTEYNKYSPCQLFSDCGPYVCMMIDYALR